MNQSLMKYFRHNQVQFLRFLSSYKPVKRPNLKNENNQQQLPTNPPMDKKFKNLSLAEQLTAKILASGPITVAEYMKHVLTNPKYGYYMHKDMFGVHGDFITSPEISQIFGELVAIWLLTEWHKLGSPTPCNLIELGPGRGTLMQDILRVLDRFQTGNKFSVHVLEISPHLSKIQAKLLCPKQNTTLNYSNTSSISYQKGITPSGIRVSWYRHLKDIPKGFALVIAHEFFDALPVHKLKKDNRGVWKEILIDIDQNSPLSFRYVLSKSQTPISKVFCPVDTETRYSLEYSIEANVIIENLANRFHDNGGIALIVDYGHFGEKTDTFRGFKNHKLQDPLIDPGSSDLTADVDFRQLKATAEIQDKLITFGPIKQAQFLQRMEGEARLEALLDSCPEERCEQIKSAYEMLIDPRQMGDRFKVFAMYPSVLRDYLTNCRVTAFND